MKKMLSVLFSILTLLSANANAKDHHGRDSLDSAESSTFDGFWSFMPSVKGVGLSYFQDATGAVDSTVVSIDASEKSVAESHGLNRDGINQRRGRDHLSKKDSSYWVDDFKVCAKSAK